MSDSAGGKGQPGAGIGSVPLLSLLCRGDPLGWFASDLSSRVSLGSTVFTHWEWDPWFTREPHGLGSLQSPSGQEKVCLLYSTGNPSALVRRSSAESPLVPSHLLCGRPCFGKLSFWRHFAGAVANVLRESQQLPQEEVGCWWLLSHARFTKSSPELAWGRRQPAAVLHSCAGALSQPSGLLCLRKEGSPALLPSTWFQPSPRVHAFSPNTQVHPSRGEPPETPACEGGSPLAGKCLSPPSGCSSGRLQSVLMPSVPPAVPACCSSARLPCTLSWEALPGMLCRKSFKGSQWAYGDSRPQRSSSASGQQGSPWDQPAAAQLVFASIQDLHQPVGSSVEDPLCHRPLLLAGCPRAGWARVACSHPHRGMDARGCLKSALLQLEHTWAAGTAPSSCWSLPLWRSTHSCHKGMLAAEGVCRGHGIMIFNICKQ